MKKKLFIVLLLIAFILGIAIIAFISLNKDEDNPSNSKKSKIAIKTLDYNDLQEMEDVEVYLDEDKDYKDIFLTGNFSDNIINNEKDALQEINEVKDVLGISNVETEFKFEMENSVSKDYKNYRIQQYYEDIPVDGMQLIVSTDEHKNVASITGNYLKIDDFETKPEIKESKLEEIIQNKYGNDTKIESKELIIEEADGKPVLVWRCLVSGEFKVLEEDAYFIHIDAKSGEILKEEDIFYDKTESAKCSAEIDGEVVRFDASKYKNKEKYVLEDKRRWIVNNNEVSSPNKDSWDDIDSVKAFIYLQKTYDYYHDVLFFDLTKSGEIKVKTNLNNNDKNNASCGFYLIYTQIKIGTGDGINYRNFGTFDVMAHELTHSYVAQTCGMFSSVEINEGYADAIGCSIENFYNDPEIEWLHGEGIPINDVCTRNLENPESMGTPSVVCGEFYDSSLDGHHNATVLGHTAYLMYKEGFSIIEITRIFADSCNILTKNAGYTDVGLAFIEKCKLHAPNKVESLKKILQNQNIIYTIALDLPSVKDKVNDELSSLSDNNKENTKSSTFTIGDNTLHYGKYSGSGTKVIDTSVAEASITITLNEDKTYTYESTNQEVCKNHSGNWEIKDNKLILQGENALEYRPLSDDSFIELQGSGFTFLYVEDSNESVTTTSSKEIKVGDTYVKCGTYNGDAALVGDVLIINDNGTASLNGKEYTYTIGEQNIAQDRSTGDVIEDVILFNGENNFYLYALDDGNRLSQGSGFDYVYSGN